MSMSMLSSDLAATLMAIHEEKSFTKAAERLGLTQQAVSAQVKRLEATLRRRLVDRSNHAVMLTADGDAFLAYAREAQEIGDRMRQHFAQAPLVGTVRLGLVEAFSSNLLPAVLTSLKQHQPNLEIIAEASGTERLLSRLESQRLDIVLGARRVGGRADEVLWIDEARWIGDPALVADAKAPVPLIVPPEPNIIRTILIEALTAAGRPFSVLFESASQSSRRAAMLAGIGVTTSCDSFEDELPPPSDWLRDLPPIGKLEFFLKVSHDASPVVARFAEIMRRQAIDVMHNYSSGSI